MEVPKETDILIVGAGPSGMSLALALQQLNVHAFLVDKQEEGANTSRAAVVHARTLEVLEPLGVTPELLSNGLKVSTFCIRDRDRVLLNIGFEKLPTPYPFTLMCPQYRTEEILLRRLQALGGRVARPTEVVAARPAPEGVQVDLAHAGASQTVNAKWVVGCDGAHSTIREDAGIGFEGAAYTEDFVLADVHMDWPLSRQEVSLFFSAEGLIVVAPLPGDSFRLVATAEVAPEKPQIEFMQNILDRSGPINSAGRIHDIVWASRFRIQHRIADTVHKGRVLLCGDAAHIHSPAGGQGMNTGIQDAVSLAAPLVMALQSGDVTELTAWAERRHSVAKSVLGITDKMTRAATLSSTPARLIRNAALAFVGHLPKAREMIARKLAELDSR